MTDSRTDAQYADVLIVDDTPANLRLLTRMVAEQGYHARPVPSGSLALAAVHAEPPDLILLDIRMPEMNGYEVCEHLKTDAQTRDIPIIFISALDAVEDKLRAFSAGGVDYVTKPFQAEEVLARVKTHLILRRLQRELQDANAMMAAELALAGEVQAGFLPHELPNVPGWQLTAALQPARETSGDFYDLIPLPGGRLGMVIADVSDKGAAAALYMALSSTLIRTYAPQYPSQPELVLNAANLRILKDTQTDQFVTVFYGVLDLDAGTLLYANAGHWPPYLVSGRKGGSAQRLVRTGMPLGILEDQTWGQGVAQVAPGGALVLYTDGITEAQNEHGTSYGEDRLLRSVRAGLQDSGQTVHDSIMTSVLNFVGGMPQSDDIALMVMVRDAATDE